MNKKLRPYLPIIIFVSVVIIAAIILGLAKSSRSTGAATLPFEQTPNGGGGGGQYCGDYTCWGSEIVTCDRDCGYINVMNNPVTIFDLTYDDTYPSYLRFKVRNYGPALHKDSIRFAFAGNGESCSASGRGYKSTGIIGPQTIPTHGMPAEYTEVVIQGGQPLFDKSRHCNNPIRIGMFTTGLCCGQEQYIAITNSVLRCT